MASSSGLSQRFLRIISPLLLDSFVQKILHIGLARRSAGATPHA
jgi:hypothetical protein